MKIVAIDGTATGSTKIGTTENNSRQFIVEEIVFEITAQNTATVGLSASVGTNSASYDNILGISATGMTATNAVKGYTMAAFAAGLVSVNPGTDIYVKITTGATAVSETVAVTLVGYYTTNQNYSGLLDGSAS